jgi:hypothetical protein
MILTDRLVFLHLHKSGGTFVSECLLRHVPAAHEIGYHLPRHMAPPSASGLPMLGFVRNPWGYYVSWYAFQADRAQPNALYRLTSDDGRRDFKGTIHALLSLASDETRLARLIAEMPGAYGNRGINLPGFALAGIRGSGLGFYSYLYRYMFGPDDGRVRIGRMETLRDELPAMLESTGTPLNDEMRTFIAQAAPRNTTEHSRYTDYYDEELSARVADLDAPVIARHGYAFGS